MMTESIACPRCGSTQPGSQRFCGECGAALREGVTRPLTANERALLEDRARLMVPAGEGRTQAGPGREPTRRSPLVTGLGLVLVLLLLAGLVVGVIGLLAGQRTPADVTLVEQGHSAKLGPGVVLTMTQMAVQPSIASEACNKNGVSTVWAFDIASTNANANILVDQPSIHLVDSTGRIYSGQRQCYLQLSDTFARPVSLPDGSLTTARIILDVLELSPEANYLDLYVLISGTHYAFRAPLP